MKASERITFVRDAIGEGTAKVLSAECIKHLDALTKEIEAKNERIDRSAKSDICLHDGIAKLTKALSERDEALELMADLISIAQIPMEDYRRVVDKIDKNPDRRNEIYEQICSALNIVPMRVGMFEEE